MKLPESLKPFAGRILDTDSHEQMPAQIWEREFGEIAKPLAAAMMNQPPSNPNHANCEGYVDDTMEIDPDRIWKQKGPRSPGAVDMRRRLDVMDQMAVARQLMFPTSLGLWGTALYSTPKGSLLYEKFGGEGAYDYAKKLFDANNRWAVNAAKVSDRIRPVTPVYGDTVEELIAVTKPLIDSGIKAISLVASRARSNSLLLHAGRGERRADDAPGWREALYRRPDMGQGRGFRRLQDQRGNLDGPMVAVDLPPGAAELRRYHDRRRRVRPAPEAPRRHPGIWRALDRSDGGDAGPLARQQPVGRYQGVR
jgi:hypothetical protein